MVVNTHLETHTSDLVRWYQLERIVQYTEEYLKKRMCDAVVILGDMNTIFGNEAIVRNYVRYLKDLGYQDAFNGQYHQTMRFLPRPFNYVDRVLVKGCEVSETKVLYDVKISDHYPIVVKVRV